jgi:hypothetical protein
VADSSVSEQYCCCCCCCCILLPVQRHKLCCICCPVRNPQVGHVSMQRLKSLQLNAIQQPQRDGGWKKASIMHPQVGHVSMRLKSLHPWSLSRTLGSMFTVHPSVI